MTLPVALLLAITACERREPAAPPPAARVEHRQPESSLPLVVLTADAARRLGIETQPVELRPVARVRRYPGAIVVPSGRELVLHAPFTALVRGLSPDAGVGARVAAGAELLRLEPLPSADRQTLSPAERTSVARARADLALLASQLDAELASLALERDADEIAAERAAAMLESGAGSARGRDEAQAKLALTEQKLASTRERRSALAGLAMEAEASPAHAPVALGSPWNATVTELHVAEGQMVAAGAPLLAIADLGELWLRVDVPAVDVAELAVDAPARVRTLSAPVDGPAGEGALALPVAAPPRADFASATVERLFALGEASRSFRPGERASVALALAAAAESKVVRSSALLRDVHGGAWIYVTAGEHSFRRVRVELERDDGEIALLARGPAEGTPVVIAGAAELYGTEFGAGK